jgi:intracellular multiplication protein IcmE
MAVVRDRMKRLFSDARSRLVIILTAGIMLAGIVLGYFYFRHPVTGPASTAQLTNAPGTIQSIPGSQAPTEQYAKLVEEDNKKKAAEALKNSGSSIPTISTLGQIGQGTEVPQQGGLGFAGLSQQNQFGGQGKPLWFDELTRNNCSPTAVQAAIKGGAKIEDLKKAGCTASQLRAAGISASDMKVGGFDVAALKTAGYSALDMKNAGFSAADLRKGGVSGCELRSAGFTAGQLKDGGYSDDELRGAGYTPEDIKTATGIPAGMTADDIRKAGCSTEALKQERAAGVSAAAIHKIAGCSAAQLKAAGYSAKDLKDAGFSAKDLKDAGYSAKDLKDAGFTAGELRDAGFSAKDLKDAGFTPKELKDAGFSAKDLKDAGFSAKDLKDAGFPIQDLVKAGFTDDQLKNAGVSDGDLAAAKALASGLPKGWTADQIAKAGCTQAALTKEREAGVSAAEIRKIAGCSAAQLKAAGYTAKELKDAGFTAGELKAAGFSAKDLKDAGFTAKDLKDAGFSAADLKAAGFSAKDLKDAGFTAKDLKDAGFSAADLKAAGFSAADLKNAGFSAKELKDAGFTAAQLKDAGFSAGQLLAAGFTPSALKAAGFTPEQLKAAGLSNGILKQAGFSDKDLGIVPPPVENPLTATTPQPSNQDNADKRFQEIAARQNAQLALQQQEQRKQALIANMSAQMGTLTAQWQPVTQTYVAGQALPAKGAGTEGGSAAGALNAKGDKVDQPLAPGGVLVKAGDIMYAVLSNTVNSDEDGPVMAEIVGGPFKGGKLLGRFNRPAQAKTVMLSFTTLSLPDRRRTINISAIAIDPNTARIALASHVDSHYLLRYGTLFGSSFMQGLGQAFQTQGATITLGTPTGTAVSTQAQRTFTDNLVVSLQAVGSRVGTQTAPYFNTPPTVTVNSGTSLGILFSNDTEVPAADLEAKTTKQ